MEHPSVEESFLGAGLSQASSIAKLLTKMGRSSMKGTVDLFSAKHVSLKQILGKWRLSQEVEVRKGAFVSCPATIEFCEDHDVISYFEGNEFVSKFTFREREWPRTCTITFEAEAFQGPRDDVPIRMLYRGRFKKSIMNPNVIFIRGSMYRVSTSIFGAKQKRKVGKFKMTQRRYQGRR